MVLLCVHAFTPLQGLDALLDTLEVCPAYMCKQVLGMIADILHSNHNAKPYAVAWRSYQGMHNLTQVHTVHIAHTSSSI
jgi:hypothetical protein